MHQASYPCALCEAELQTQKSTEKGRAIKPSSVCSGPGSTATPSPPVPVRHLQPLHFRLAEHPSPRAIRGGTAHCSRLTAIHSCLLQAAALWLPRPACGWQTVRLPRKTPPQGASTSQDWQQHAKCTGMDSHSGTQLLVRAAVRTGDRAVCYPLKPPWPLAGWVCSLRISNSYRHHYQHSFCLDIKHLPL